MSAYEALAGVYDRLTEDVGYERRADYLEKLFRKSRIPVRMVPRPGPAPPAGSTPSTAISGATSRGGITGTPTRSTTRR